jgi:hypothetical protein
VVLETLMGLVTDEVEGVVQQVGESESSSSSSGVSASRKIKAMSTCPERSIFRPSTG